MTTGSITRIVRDRGFGFIKAADSTEELFFHSSSVEEAAFDDLNEGENVEFDVEPDPKNSDRNRATHVRLGS